MAGLPAKDQTGMSFPFVQGPPQGKDQTDASLRFKRGGHPDKAPMAES